MAVSTSVLMSGTRASQPAAATAYNGIYYRVTDEGNIIEQCDGSAWVKIAVAIGAALTSDPSSPSNGWVWFFNDAGTPPSISLRWRSGGVTYDFPLGTAT